MFNRKQQEIERLRQKLQNREDFITSLERQYKRDRKAYEEIIAELERTNLPSYDMNVLFGTVLDYRRCMRHVGAPDPVEGNREVRRVFEKYRVKF